MDIPVDNERTIRLTDSSTALVVVDMQNFFLHKALFDHPTGLACVDPLLPVVPAVRKRGVRIILLDLYLPENGIKSLLFAGVNADQCVMGTFPDAFFRGYDVVMLRDATVTTSPEGGLESALYNASLYGFVTDTKYSSPQKVHNAT
ncbi:Isochorismatase hydrolase [Punctularia strigosozonata HHB-11173 SS5]|uniref:Isochorismatase hydrolase n=1 Tax=Punctularia strigosozonata (strain HHB-11173) TaxID=741275 RepID=UPI0004417B68|nr:Isochorismatase hydrolase [Punctularia strigosozonata HHB-11173 SS5]EIN13782.1 Isochorismatase hydrolase [Punctularia strigosozonata HHB-11173 SS5]